MNFDTIIENGTIVDGSGQRTGYRGDVGIRNGKIEAIGALESAEATTRIDAKGKIVSPGFIDVHVHSEIALIGGEGDRYGGVAQGVTTHFLAPDGFGWAPLTEQAARELWDYTLFAYGGAGDINLEWSSPEAFLSVFNGNTPANVVPQVPHCAVRLGVMGWEPRHATDEELDRMRALTREWMEAGAVGLCVGLDYQPTSSADTREMIELSKVVGEYGGYYAAHIRNQEIGKVAAWRETMQIGKESGIPVHISHEFVDDVTEPLLEEAAGVCDLTIESYLYRAGCTHLSLMLPIWAQAGGPAAQLERLKEPEARRKMAEHLGKLMSERKAVGGDAIFSVNQSGRFIGQSLMRVAEEQGRDLGEFALQILEEEWPYSVMIFHHGGLPEEQESIVRRTIQHPRMVVASDGIYHGPHPHPRGFGCFVRVLGRNVREQGYITLEEAIYKMSGFPAERFGVTDRGRLETGLAADVVVFDPETVLDQATWESPFESPIGIELVMVNGEIAVEAGRPTGRLPGRVVRRGEK